MYIYIYHIYIYIYIYTCKTVAFCNFCRQYFCILLWWVEVLLYCSDMSVVNISEQPGFFSRSSSKNDGWSKWSMKFSWFCHVFWLGFGLFHAIFGWLQRQFNDLAKRSWLAASQESQRVHFEQAQELLRGRLVPNKGDLAVVRMGGVRKLFFIYIYIYI